MKYVCSFCGKVYTDKELVHLDYYDGPRCKEPKGLVLCDGKVVESLSSKVVWRNECALVRMGEELSMGLTYVRGREVQVSICETGGDSLTEQLKGQSVRITIEVVAGGYK